MAPNRIVNIVHRPRRLSSRSVAWLPHFFSSPFPVFLMHDKGHYYALNGSGGRMDIVGWVIGGISIVIGIAGILDARRQRNIVERLSQHQSETIQNLHGF